MTPSPSLSLVPQADIQAAVAAGQTVGSVDAERALLGCVLYDNSILTMIGGTLAPDHFIEPAHAAVFEKILGLIQRSQRADLITVCELLGEDEAFQKIGGMGYLAEVYDHAPPARNAPDYARIILDCAIRRNLFTLCEETAHALLKDRDVSAFEMASGLRTKLEHVESAAASEDASMISAPDAAANALEAMRELAVTGKQRGRMTGLRCVDRRLGGLKPGALIVVGGRPGMAKAQPLDAKILLRDGSWKPMGAVRLGDELASIDGAQSRVAGIYPQGERAVFRVTFSDGRSAECCDEHLWRVTYRDWPEPRIMSTAQIAEKLLAKRYRGRLWIDLVSGHFGATTDLPIDPWVLGALIGDGCLKKSTPRFTSADDELVDRMSDLLGEQFEVRYASQYDYSIVTAGGHRIKGRQGVEPNALGQAVHALGLNLRSEDKFIPAAYLSADRAARVEVLRGLMDTDGAAETFNTSRFSTSSERLARDVVALVRSLGGVASLRSFTPTYRYRGEKRTGLVSHRVGIGGLAPDEVFSLSRKRARLRDRTGSRRLTIKSVEHVRSAEVQCIRVTHPTRLYVTDDYVVTHNTGLARAIAHGAAARNPDYLFPFLGIEMGPEEMMQRELSALSHELGEGVEYRAMGSGALTPMDFQNLHAASQKVPANLILDDCHALTLEDVRRKVWSLNRRGRVGAVFIDYLQIMRRPAANGRNETSVLGEITAGLKQIARQAETCVVLLSQLSRQVENRDDKRPQLSDLRESGSIEQDADAVLFPYREFYYVERAEPKPDSTAYIDWQVRCEDLRRRLDVICAKQRQGPAGSDRQRYFAEFDFIDDDREADQ